MGAPVQTLDQYASRKPDGDEDKEHYSEIAQLVGVAAICHESLPCLAPRLRVSPVAPPPRKTGLVLPALERHAALHRSHRGRRHLFRRVQFGLESMGLAGRDRTAARSLGLCGVFQH